MVSLTKNDMEYIKDVDSLLSHGEVELREAALKIIDHSLLNSDPYIQVRNMVKLEGDKLTVGDLTYDLNEYGDIYVLGAGKATFPIAKALDDILKDRIKEGTIICKYGQEGELNYSNLHLANHPVPDKATINPSQDMMNIAKKTKAKDIVFSCITGGSTSLMQIPVQGVTLDDLIITYKLLLRSSANIIEMNSVRKHLCNIKGGRLAKSMHPEAEIINLTVSDVIGDPFDYITCPTVPDTSTLNDARQTLTKYDLWDNVPVSVSDFFKNAGDEHETPKDLSTHTIHDYMIIKGDAACVAAAKKSEELGFETMILSTMLEGESKEVGSTYAAIAKEIRAKNRPLKAPCAIIGGGETTMKIDGDAGRGGPNQQFALAAATWIENMEEVVIAGIDTDGVDGFSDLAGGIVDGYTMEAARKKGIDVFQHINEFNETPALKELGDGIYTGATGTNVNDLKILLIK